MGLISLYLENVVGYILFFLPIYILIRVTVLKRRKTKVILKKEVLLGLGVSYLIGLLSQTIIPLWHAGFDNSNKFYFEVFIRPEKSLNLLPFSTVREYLFTSNNLVSDWESVSILNLLGNVGLFIPLGILIPFIWKKRLGETTLLGFALSLCIEIFQYFIGRSADIDDLILNVIGTSIGYGVMHIFNSFRVNISPTKKR